MNVRRIMRLVKKELIQTRRDKRMMGLIFGAPIMQLLLFGYAVSTDVNHVSTAILDEDHTSVSRQFVERINASPYFDYRYSLNSPRQIDRFMDTGQAQVVLRVPRGFGSAVASGRTASLQTILDGSDSMTARIVNGYVNGIVRQYAASLTAERIDRFRSILPSIPRLEPRLRVWYNPDLKSVHFMIPGVLCVILLIVTMMMTATAIVREREIGTLEQLIVTPISSYELMLGKTLPFLGIGMVDLTLVLGLAMLWFHTRVAGSIPLLFGLSLVFLMTSLGLGILISTLSKNQHEATLTSFFFFLPFILLSGMMYPIENMPQQIQWLTYLIPLRYFLEIIRGIFLKGIGLEVLWPQALVLLAFGVGILWVSALRFHKRLS